VFEKHPAGIFACQHYILGAGNGYGNHKNLKLLYRGKLVKHIPDAIEENVLTSFSTAKEVSSKVKLLQAVRFVAGSWQEIGSTTIQSCFSHCGLKHSGLEMPETAKSEYEAFLEVQNLGTMKNLKVSTIMLNVTMKMKIVRMKLLKAFYQNNKTRY
jgi:hypothetical protein